MIITCGSKPHATRGGRAHNSSIRIIGQLTACGSTAASQPMVFGSSSALIGRPRAKDRCANSPISQPRTEEDFRGPSEPATRRAWISRPPARSPEQRKPPAAPRGYRTRPATGTRPNSNATATILSAGQRGKECPLPVSHRDRCRRRNGARRRLADRNKEWAKPSVYLRSHRRASHPIASTRACPHGGRASQQPTPHWSRDCSGALLPSQELRQRSPRYVTLQLTKRRRKPGA